MQPKILIICNENEKWQYSIIEKYLSAHGISESYIASSLRIANDIFLIENIDLIVSNTTINGRITIDSICLKTHPYGWVFLSIHKPNWLFLKIKTSKTPNRRNLIANFKILICYEKISRSFCF